MDKIIFEDYPSINTPLNADNLNALQNNIENAMGNIDTSRISAIENKDIEQDGRLDNIEGAIENATSDIEIKDTEQDGRLDNIEGAIDNSIGDTGWIELKWTSNFTGYDAGEVPIIRKKNGIVQVQGVAKTTVVLSGDHTTKTMFTIPPEFRPTTTIRVVQHGSSRAKWLFIIYPTGDCTISRYTADGSTWTDITTGQWLPFTAIYLV